MLLALVGHATNGYAAVPTYEAVRWALRSLGRCVRSFRPRPAFVGGLAAAVALTGCAVLVVRQTAVRPSGTYALPFAPDAPYRQRVPDPAPRAVSAIRPPAAAGAGADRVAQPYDLPAEALNAMLLTAADVTESAHVHLIEPVRARRDVLDVRADPRPCPASSVEPRWVGDAPFAVWRMTGARPTDSTYFASSATELADPGEAHDLLSQVAAAGPGCGYTALSAGPLGDAVVRLTWRDGGAYRDLVLVRVGNLVFQVGTTQEAAGHSGTADLLARRLMARWSAELIGPRPAPATAPTPSAGPGRPASTPEPWHPPPGGPQPTGTPPNPPGCLPPVCGRRVLAN